MPRPSRVGAPPRALSRRRSRATAGLGGPVPRPVPSTSRMNSSSSRFALLRMLTTSIPCAVSAREDLVQVLVLVHLDLERAVVRAASRRSPAGPAPRRPRAQVEHEDLGVELAQHGRHAVVLDDAALVDDRDVAAESLGLLEVVRRQDDGRALLVDLRAGTPTSSGASRCPRRPSARRGSAAAARAPARARSSAGASCRRRACARSRRACPRAAAASASARRAAARCGAGCRRSRPGSRRSSRPSRTG